MADPILQSIDSPVWAQYWLSPDDTKLLIPINIEGRHWLLIAADPSTGRCHFLDSLPNESTYPTDRPITLSNVHEAI